jgi:hypothetical protein
MKSKFTLLTLLFMAGVFRLLAVPMSGTYTVGGTTPAFPTLQRAIDTLAARGLSGPVVFDIRPGTYNGQVNIGNITGVSAANTITIESETHDSTSVILTDTSSLSTGNFLFHVFGTDRLILKHLTLHRIGTVTNCTVVNLASNSKYFKMLNCVVKNDFTTGTADEQSLVYFPLGSSGDSTITFDHNVFVNGSWGLYLYGQSVNAHYVNPQITNNIFQDQSYRAIDINYCTSPVIENNTISSSNPAFTYEQIYLNRIYHNLQINNNHLIGSQNGDGIYLDSVICDSGTPGLISNNFIQPAGAAGTSNGISFADTRRVNTYNNTINVTSTGANSAGFNLGTGDTSLNFRNNIVVNDSGGVTFYLTNANIISNISTDYNDLYISGNSTVLAFNGTSYDSTLAQWQATTGQEANSVSGDPLFVAPPDLHVTSAAVNNLGQHLTQVMTDIDGDSRNVTTPDMGADEFTPMNNNLAALSFVLPVDMAFGDSTMVIAVEIKNFGLLTQTGFSVKANITGAVNTTLTQNYPGNLLSNGVDTVYFTTTINTYAGGTINIVAYTSLVSDQLHLNDTIRESFTLLPNENVGAIRFISPSKVSCGDSAMSVAIVIRNFGQPSQTGFNLTAEITGDVTTTLTQLYTDTLLSNTEDTVYFSTTINTFAGGSISIVAYSSLSIDQDNSNDTISSSFTIVPIPNAPSVQSPQTVCDNAVTITGTADSTDILLWYDQPAGGNLLFAGNDFSPALTSDTTFYVESHSGGGGVGCLRITEAQPEDFPLATGDYIEISNLSAIAIDATGYTVLAGDNTADINLYNSSVWHLGNFNAGEVQWSSDVTGAQFYWGTNLQWNNGAEGWVLILDSNNAPVDFLPFEWDSTSIANMAVVYLGDTIRPGTMWSGPGVTTCSANNELTMSRIGSGDNDMASDWSCDSVSPGLQNVHLDPVFAFCGIGFCGSPRIPVSVLLATGVTPVNLGPDTVVANNDSLLLDAGAGYTSYLWSTGETTQTIYAMQGSYWVSVTGGANNCTYNDSININTPVQVRDLFNDDNVSLYPNPANNKLTVRINPNAIHDAIFRITDIEGRVLQVRNPNAVNGLIEFDLTSLSNGFYYLQIISGNKTGTKKFTVSH